MSQESYATGFVSASSLVMKKPKMSDLCSNRTSSIDIDDEEHIINAEDDIIITDISCNNDSTDVQVTGTSTYDTTDDTITKFGGFKSASKVFNFTQSDATSSSSIIPIAIFTDTSTVSSTNDSSSVLSEYKEKTILDGLKPISDGLKPIPVGLEPIPESISEGLIPILNKSDDSIIAGQKRSLDNDYALSEETAFKRVKVAESDWSNNDDVIDLTTSKRVKKDKERMSNTKRKDKSVVAGIVVKILTTYYSKGKILSKVHTTFIYTCNTYIIILQELFKKFAKTISDHSVTNNISNKGKYYISI